MARDSVTAAALAGVEKAAVLLLSLGPEAAADVLRHLGESEVRQVSQALARIRTVLPEQLQQVQQEFHERLRGANGLAVDGSSFARTMVSRALADPASPLASAKTAILAELEGLPSTDGGDLDDVLDGVPPESLATLLESEHPQVATLILAHVKPALARSVLQHLSEELQSELVERLARLERAVPPRVLAEVGAIVRDQVKGLMREAGGARGGPKAVAEIMKHADKATEARILDDLESRDPALVGEIRGLLFTFEDCIQLDNRSMQALLKEVAREDLLLALKTASPALSEKIFANVSSRAAEILREDMAASGPARLKDVEAAQARVVATLRELEAEGKVVIAGSGKDDVLV